MSYSHETLPTSAGTSVDVDTLLARRLRAGVRRQSESTGIHRRGSNDPALLSFAQQRLWFLDRVEPGAPLYNVPHAIRLSGSLDLRMLERALTEVIRRHESLRTTFAVVDSTPVQEISPARPFPLTVIDLQRQSATHAEQELGWRLTAEAQRPFDLKHDLMLRATVFRLKPREHVLLVTMHHIASDAWSIGILLNELAVLYNSFLDNKASPLPELAIQYADFAIWQRQSVSGPVLEKQLAYWRAKLDDAPEQIDLPCQRSGIVSAPSSQGSTRSILLPTGLTEELHKASQAAGVTLFMFLLTAFKILLYRYSGQEDVAVGSPVAGRSRLETEPLIGFFLNTLVLRTSLSSDATVTGMLAQVRKVCLEAFSNQDLPFEKLVQDLQPNRHANRTPFFQVMFTLQSTPTPPPCFRGLRGEPIEVELGVSPFDLTLFTEQTAHGLTAAIEYKTSLFDTATVDRMLSSFRVLLAAMVAEPQRRISELPLLSAADQRQLLVEWNPTRTTPEPSRCVHELIAEQAARDPSAVAVVFGQRRLTYGQLDKEAEDLAERLRSLGAGPEVLVALYVERSLDMIVGLLAVLKAGGAYVPLDPAEPIERLSFKLQDSTAPIILTQRRLLPALPNSAATVLCLDQIEPRSSASRSGPSATCANAAYVIYTSGSTGTPKGAVIEHGALANHCRAFAQRFALAPSDRVLQFAPLSFDVSVEEILPALASGASLILRPDLLSLSINDFNAFLSCHGVTVVNLPTPYWHEWMQEIDRSGGSIPDCVRTVIVGSDTVSVEQFRLWQRLSGGRVQWCNAYGITEATITSTIYEPTPDEAVEDRIPIGRPTANVRAYILDSAGHPVPVGVRGELYIGGAKAARGYLNRPELSSYKFVPDPFDSTSGARMVRTGDLARWRPDGNIEFLGRADDQVKIRGFRIELAEIESLLVQHPSVREAVVLARDFAGEKRLVAYVVPATPSPNLQFNLRDYLKPKLPAYMIPSAFVELEAMPLLSSGKVDRRALPLPDSTRPELVEPFTPATDALERQLAEIWAEVLKVERVGIHDNFFDLGGHSLLAVKLGREVEKLTGRNLPLVHLFQSPTVAQLAQLLRDEKVSLRRSSLLPIQAHGNRPPLLLVHGAGGGMLWGYANLAQYLPEDQPVYAFNSRGMDGLEEFSTLEEIAASYVEELLQFQPAGPYYLGGYCFGGEVAFEMAQQLRAKGHEVSLLALFNSFPPNSNFERLRCTPRCLGRFALNTARWLNYFRKWTPEQRRDFLRRKLILVRKGLQFRREGRAQTVEDIHAEDFIDVSEYADYQRHLWDIHLRASARYVPHPYAGHITVFRTRIHPFLCSFDPAFGWSQFAEGGCTVKVMTGAHESILDKPHVRALAEELDKCLLSAQALSQGAK